MEDKKIILRHVTPIENIPSILHEGKLSAKFTQRKQTSDSRYVAFEIYTGSIFLEQYCCKKSKVGKTFSFFFSQKHMLNDGIVFEYGHGFPSKIENQFFVCDRLYHRKNTNKLVITCL